MPTSSPAAFRSEHPSGSWKEFRQRKTMIHLSPKTIDVLAYLLFSADADMGAQVNDALCTAKGEFGTTEDGEKYLPEVLKELTLIRLRASDAVKDYFDPKIVSQFR